MRKYVWKNKKMHLKKWERFKSNEYPILRLKINGSLVKSFNEQLTRESSGGGKQIWQSLDKQICSVFCNPDLQHCWISSLGQVARLKAYPATEILPLLGDQRRGVDISYFLRRRIFIQSLLTREESEWCAKREKKGSPLYHSRKNQRWIPQQEVYFNRTIHLWTIYEPSQPRIATALRRMEDIEEKRRFADNAALSLLNCRHAEARQLHRRRHRRVSPEREEKERVQRVGQRSRQRNQWFAK